MAQGSTEGKKLEYLVQPPRSPGSGEASCLTALHSIRLGERPYFSLLSFHLGNKYIYFILFKTNFQLSIFVLILS